jgi:hypothetical protein
MPQCHVERNQLFLNNVCDLFICNLSRPIKLKKT